MSEAGYAELLRRTDLAGVYHLPQGGTDSLIKAAEDNGYQVFQVDLRKACSREDLLDTIARDMAFPEWFGHNYDALFDCLCDLGWRPAEGYVVLLNHCDSIPGRAQPDFLRTLQIFKQAAREWHDQGQSLWCLVDLQMDDVDQLPSSRG